MSITHPTGLSDKINRQIVSLTTMLGGIALAGFIVINLMKAAPYKGGESIIYGACLFTCSFFSYLYTTRFTLFSVQLLRQMDHAAIFLLIAGTYTPFAQGIKGPFGIPLLYWVWLLSTAGIVLRLILSKRYDRLFIGLYLMLGWFFLTAIPGIIHHVSASSLIFLGMGAAVYSLGALIFACDIGRWTDPVWHACVFSASGLHFVAVLDLVMGPLSA